MTETHIIGAKYYNIRHKDLVLRCDMASTSGYTWVHSNTQSYANRSHESLMKEGNWRIEYPKESLFDQLYLRMK